LDSHQSPLFPSTPLFRSNLAARVETALGDVDGALAGAERVFEATFRVPAAPASALEPHHAITWLDEDRRLVVRTSTESPFRVRRSEEHTSELQSRVDLVC